MSPRAILSCSIVAVVIPATASAEHQGVYGGPYVSLHGGASFLEDADSKVEGFPGVEAEFDFDTGFVVAGTAGYRLSNRFFHTRIEAEANYRRHEVDDVTVLGTTVDLEGDFETVGLLANFWFDLPNATPLTPYAGGGVGLGILMPGGDTDTELAWQVGAGVAFSVTPSVEVTADYRWFATADPEFETDAGELSLEYSTHNAMAGVRLGF